MQIPAVRVSLTDQSFALPPVTNPSRTVYAVTVSDRGPHNRVVEVLDQRTFHRLFGTPNIDRTAQMHYIIDRALATGARVLVTRVADPASTAATAEIGIHDATSVTVAGSPAGAYNYTFTDGSNTVTVTAAGANPAPTTADISALGINIGSWIAPETTAGAPYAGEPLYQVVGIANDPAGNGVNITLDRAYVGAQAGAATIANDVYLAQTPLKILTNGLAENLAQPTPAQTDLFVFYSDGVGSYYNNLIIRGVRSTQLEKYYADPVTGQSLYPFMFYDITVEQVNPDGSTTIIEGPWSVSLSSFDPSTGVKFVDPTTGTDLYLPTVVNNNSQFVRVIEGGSSAQLLTDQTLREYFAALLATGQVVNANGLQGEGGIRLGGGSDGNQYDNLGRLNLNNQLVGRIISAYEGSLTSLDGSIEVLRDIEYPVYEIDYIACGGYATGDPVQSASVIAAANTLASIRDDCMVIADTGVNAGSAQQDIDQRINNLTVSSYDMIIYSQYRTIYDQYTGRYITISPVYDALERHLFIDNAFFISEPVANITKGAIQEPVQLRYKPGISNGQANQLLDVQINPTITEPGGIYFLTQYTAHKANTALSRAHVVKFYHFLKKRIPPLLKDLLQRKAVPNIIDIAKQRLTGFLQGYTLGSAPSDKFVSLNSFAVDVVFDSPTKTLRVVLTIQPVDSIEQITVNIKVV